MLTAAELDNRSASNAEFLRNIHLSKLQNRDFLVNTFVNETQTTHFKGGGSEGRKDVPGNEPTSRICEFKYVETFCFYFY
jgi:hypothetical protein